MSYSATENVNNSTAKGFISHVTSMDENKFCKVQLRFTRITFVIIVLSRVCPVLPVCIGVVVPVTMASLRRAGTLITAVERMVSTRRMALQHVMTTTMMKILSGQRSDVVTRCHNDQRVPFSVHCLVCSALHC